MGHKSLTLVVATMLGCAVAGCSSSVTLEPEPVTSAPKAEQPPAADNSTSTTAPPTAERVRADRPVNSDPGAGYLGAVAGGYRSAREQIEDIPIKQAIQLFRGSEGRYPKSQEEFMEKVIKANQMQLPEIEEGYEYQYNPEDHTLYKVAIEAAEE